LQNFSDHPFLCAWAMKNKGDRKPNPAREQISSKKAEFSSGIPAPLLKDGQKGALHKGLSVFAPGILKRNRTSGRFWLLPQSVRGSQSPKQ